MVSAPRAPPFTQRVLACLATVLLIVAGHVHLSLHLMVAVNGIFGGIYLILMPVAVLLAAYVLSSFAGFGLLCLGPACAAIAFAYQRTRGVVARMNRWERVLLVPPACLWICLGVAELTRAVAMGIALLIAQPDAAEAKWLLTSLHDMGEFAPSHGWYRKDGRCHIWSYSQMRFVEQTKGWTACTGMPTQ